VNNAMFIATVSVSFFVVLIYSYNCFKKKKGIELQPIVNLILLSSGIVCGMAIIISSFYPKIKTHIGGFEIYIFISGVAVMFVSIKSVYSEITKINIDP
jgi:hypothetical protein